MVDEEPSLLVLVGVYWHYQYLYKSFRRRSVFLRVGVQSILFFYLEYKIELSKVEYRK